MSNLEPVTLTAPASWASCLINGDSSGLEGEDLVACNLWIDDVVKDYGHANFVDCSYEPKFTWGYWDSKYLTDYKGADILEYTLLVSRPK